MGINSFEHPLPTVKNWGIHRRVLLLALLPAISVAVVLSGYSIYALLGDLNFELETASKGMARQLAAIAEFSTYSGDRQALHRIAIAALDERNITNVEIFDVSGTPLAASGAMPKHLEPLPPDRDLALLASDEEHLLISAPIFRQQQEIDDPFLLTSADNPYSPPLLGWVVIEVSKQTLDKRKKEATTLSLLALFIAISITTVIASWQAREFIRPILRLHQAVDRIRRGDLSLRIPADSRGEMRTLEEGFNAMASALSENQQTMQLRIAEATAELAAKKEEAERASLAKSRFLAAASHDLRQPLHALSLFVADLDKTIDSPDGQRIVGRISTSVANISELLSTLLDISRLDIAGINPEPRPFPLMLIFNRLEQSFARAAIDKKLWLKTRPTPYWVYSDPALLERLLANLVANAIQYTEQGGVLLAARLRNEKIIVEVRDSGIGIPEEHRNTIFEEFFQVANQARESSKGLGLGLAIVSRIARSLQTPVKVRSAPGAGSTFTVELIRSNAQSVNTTIKGSTDEIVILIDPLNKLTGLSSQINDWGYSCQSLEKLEGTEKLTNSNTCIITTDPESATSCINSGKHLLHRVILITDYISPSPPHLHTLPLPLKPAKLRALLLQVFSNLPNQR